MPPEPQRAPQRHAGACGTDVECQACPAERGCGCEVASSAEACTPPLDECYAPPCKGRSASCWAGHCVLRSEVAGPCESDEQCEVRADDCRCDLYPALSSDAPPANDCDGSSCRTRPDPAQFAARCDPAAHRCVLGRAPKATSFTLRRSCDLHGTVISNERIEVTSAPPMIRIAADGQPSREAPLAPEALTTLSELLGGRELAAFVDETPVPGEPHPGMTVCTLDIESSAITVEGKRWASSDRLGPAALAGRDAIGAELGRLRKLAFPR